MLWPSHAKLLPTSTAIKWFQCAAPDNSNGRVRVASARTHYNNWIIRPWPIGASCTRSYVSGGHIRPYTHGNSQFVRCYFYSFSASEYPFHTMPPNRAGPVFTRPYGCQDPISPSPPLLMLWNFVSPYLFGYIHTMRCDVMHVYRALVYYLFYRRNIWSVYLRLSICVDGSSA